MMSIFIHMTLRTAMKNLAANKVKTLGLSLRLTPSRVTLSSLTHH